MRRRDLVIPALSGALASCARRQPASARTIQVGVRSILGMSPFYVALERGYFRDAGIDARPQTIERNAETVALLAAGRLDIAITAVEPAFFNAVARGSDVRVVLGRERITQSCGDSGALYARKAAFPRGTADIREWRGKKIAAGQGAGLGEFLLDTILSRARIDPNQTPRPRISPGQAAAALSSGAIDGLLQSSNWSVSLESDSNIVREDAGRASIPGIQTSYILFGPGLLHGEISAGGRFLGCYLRGVRDFERGVTPHFLRNLTALQGSPGALDRCRRYSTPGGAIDRESIGLFRDWAVNRGYTPAGIEVESLTDDRFLRFAQEARREHPPAADAQTADEGAGCGPGSPQRKEV